MTWRDNRGRRRLPHVRPRELPSGAGIVVACLLEAAVLVFLFLALGSLLLIADALLNGRPS